MNDPVPPSELRLFISSTFRDLHDEREYLVKKIFPEIRSLCRERGVTFTEIDLRWGLTEEEAVHGRVVRACLEEIDRCRPHFIGILGSRYGWRPEYHEVAMDPELHTRYPWVEEAALAGKSILEIEFTQAVVHADCRYANFYRREQTPDGEDRTLLDALVAWLGPSRSIRDFSSPEELGRLVRDDLTELIEQTWPEQSILISPWQSEERRHRSFAQSRRRAYIAIPEYLQTFTDWADSPGSPLIISGESGMGKSALVAWLADTWRRRNPDGFVIEHYVGCSAGSGDHAGLLRRVIGEIHRRYGIEEEIPESTAELEESFPAWLGRVGGLPGYEGDRLLLAIDALDQLLPTSQHLAWLPERTPENVLLVASTRPGPIRDRLAERHLPQMTLRPVHRREREAIVVRYLGEFHKGLPAGVVARIGEDPKGGSPLFLRTLAEELRLHGVHEELEEALDRYLAADDLEALFQLVLERMEEDYGAAIVGPVLSGIAVSRAGLTESDIIGVSGVSRADLSILLFALDFHLLRSNGRLDFFHGYLKRAVEQRYLRDKAIRREQTTRLADWLEERLALGDAHAPRQVDPEGVVEFLNALAESGRTERLIGVLGDPMVILSTFEGEHAYDLLQIWERSGALEEAPGACAEAVRRGRQIGLDPELTVDLMIRIARLLRSLGSWHEAEIWGVRGVELARDIGDPRKEAEALEGLGDLLLLRGDYDGAREAFEGRRQICVDYGDDLAVAHADGEIGMIEMEQGNYDEALRRFNRMYEVSRREGDRPDMARALGRIGQIHAGRGEHQAALRKYREALELFSLLGDRSRMAFIEGEIGLIAWNRKEYEEAMEHYRREEQIYRVLGDRHGAAMAGCKIGLIHVDRNDLDRAEECFTDYLRTTTELGYRRGIGFAQGDLGIVRLRRGELDQAMQLFDRALHTHRDLGFPLGIALWLKWKAEVVLAQSSAGDPPSPEQIARARAWAEESGRIATSIGKTDAVSEAAELVSKLAALGSPQG